MKKAKIGTFGAVFDKKKVKKYTKRKNKGKHTTATDIELMFGY